MYGPNNLDRSLPCAGPDRICLRGAGSRRNVDEHCMDLGGALRGAGDPIVVLQMNRKLRSRAEYVPL